MNTTPEPMMETEAPLAHDMANAEADPLDALVAAGQFKKDDEILDQNLQALSLYFNTQ